MSENTIGKFNSKEEYWFIKPEHLHMNLRGSRTLASSFDSMLEAYRDCLINPEFAASRVKHDSDFPRIYSNDFIQSVAVARLCLELASRDDIYDAFMDSSYAEFAKGDVAFSDVYTLPLAVKKSVVEYSGLNENPLTVYSIPANFVNGDELIYVRSGDKLYFHRGTQGFIQQNTVKIGGEVFPVTSEYLDLFEMIQLDNAFTICVSKEKFEQAIGHISSSLQEKYLIDSLPTPLAKRKRNPKP